MTGTALEVTLLASAPEGVCSLVDLSSLNVDEAQVSAGCDVPVVAGAQAPTLAPAGGDGRYATSAGTRSR